MPVLALLALSVLANAQDQPPRLRTLLANGAAILVENLPQSKVASVQLFASSLRIPDTPGNHGYKHLLEHLILKGPKKDLDQRMERDGIYFAGRTLRDEMQIQFTCAPGQVGLALQGLAETLRPLEVTPQEISFEIGILKQEHALDTDFLRLSNACWSQAFGSRGVDPFGNLDTMSKATPAALRAFQSRLFAPNDLILVISGPVDVDAVTKMAKQVLNEISGKNLGAIDHRPMGKSGRVELSDAFGEARGALVAGSAGEATANALAAAFALDTLLPGISISYTPSGDPGLVVIGRSEANSGLGLKIDAMVDSEAAGLFERGRNMALTWLRQELANPSASAEMRGLLMCDGLDNSPEQIVDNLSRMNWQGFVKGIRAFGRDEAVIAVGTR